MGTYIYCDGASERTGGDISSETRVLQRRGQFDLAKAKTPQQTCAYISSDNRHSHTIVLLLFSRNRRVKKRIAYFVRQARNLFGNLYISQYAIRCNIPLRAVCKNLFICLV